MLKVVFLQAAEFNGELLRQKKKENIHKNIFGLTVVLELKVETFKVIFLCQKSTESFSILFSLKNIKKGQQLLLLSYFDNFDF